MKHKWLIVLISVVVCFSLLLAFLRFPLYRENYEIYEDGCPIIVSGEKYLHLDGFSGYVYTGEFKNDDTLKVYEQLLGFYFGNTYYASYCSDNKDGLFIKTKYVNPWFVEDDQNIYYNENIKLPEPIPENVESVLITEEKETTEITDRKTIKLMCKYVDRDKILDFPFEKFIDVNDQNDASGYFSVFLKFKDFDYLQFDVGEWILDDEQTGEFNPERISLY